MQGKRLNNITLMKTLGSIIKKYRKLQGKTIYKISAEAYISKSTWREAELGVCQNITLITLWKISEGLDVPLCKIIEELNQKLGEDFTLSDLE